MLQSIETEVRIDITVYTVNRDSFRRDKTVSQSIEIALGETLTVSQSIEMAVRIDITVLQSIEIGQLCYSRRRWLLG